MAKKNKPIDTKQSYEILQNEIANLNNLVISNSETSTTENVVSLYYQCLQKLTENERNTLLDVFTNKFIGLNRTIIMRTTDLTIEEFIDNATPLTQEVFKLLTQYISIIKIVHKIYSKEIISAHCHDLLNLVLHEGCRLNTDILYQDKHNIITFGKTAKNLKGQIK